MINTIVAIVTIIRNKKLKSFLIYMSVTIAGTRIYNENWFWQNGGIV